jgi:hypothetical protein
MMLEYKRALKFLCRYLDRYPLVYSYVDMKFTNICYVSFRLELIQVNCVAFLFLRQVWNTKEGGRFEL